jgi:hypothetical protein
MGFWPILPQKLGKTAMGYGVCLQIPAFQLRNLKILWVIIEYGLSGVWVRRVSTVLVLLPIMRPSRSMVDLVGETDRRCRGGHPPIPPTRPAERRATPQHGLYKGANTRLPQSPCACTNKIKDKWDIQYNPQSTQFMGKNVRAMNLILACQCLDTCIRSASGKS